MTPNMHITRHALTKGFTADEIAAVVSNPTRITDVRRYPGQRRYIGNGIAVVVDETRDTVVTVYLDGVVTPLRPDQMNDQAALNSARLRRLKYPTR